MVTPSTDNNPLRIPEIRSRLARCVSVKDAISCVRVSKQWHQDFVLPIWYAVNFTVHTKFELLHPDIIDKNGHYIRVIENLTEVSELKALLRSSIHNVQSIKAICNVSVQFRILCLDLIQNNNQSLKDMTLEMDDNARPPDLSARMFTVHAFISTSSPSKLSRIRLHGICF
ncbi:hypothetical protein EDD11_000443, partial [Mortierella claussenii]